MYCLSVLPSHTLLSSIHPFGLHISELFARHSFVTCDLLTAVCEAFKLSFSFSVSMRYNFKQLMSRFLCSMP
jgi:hypothetical protein